MERVIRLPLHLFQTMDYNHYAYHKDIIHYHAAKDGLDLVCVRKTQMVKLCSEILLKDCCVRWTWEEGISRYRNYRKFIKTEVEYNSLKPSFVNRSEQMPTGLYLTHRTFPLFNLSLHQQFFLEDDRREEYSKSLTYSLINSYPQVVFIDFCLNRNISNDQVFQIMKRKVDRPILPTKKKPNNPEGMNCIVNIMVSSHEIDGSYADPKIKWLNPLKPRLIDNEIYIILSLGELNTILTYANTVFDVTASIKYTVNNFYKNEHYLFNDIERVIGMCRDLHPFKNFSYTHQIEQINNEIININTGVYPFEIININRGDYPLEKLEKFNNITIPYLMKMMDKKVMLFPYRKFQEDSVIVRFLATACEEEFQELTMEMELEDQKELELFEMRANLQESNQSVQFEALTCESKNVSEMTKGENQKEVQHFNEILTKDDEIQQLLALQFPATDGFGKANN